jgi:hypothetical protein
MLVAGVKWHMASGGEISQRRGMKISMAAALGGWRLAGVKRNENISALMSSSVAQ